MVAEMSAKYPNRKFFYVRCDMCNFDSIRSAFREAVQLAGNIDILINNSGWTIDPTTFQKEVDDETDEWLTALEGEFFVFIFSNLRWFELIFRCWDYTGHLVGTVLITRLVMSHWKKNDIEGVCISTASIVGMLPHLESGPTFHPDISVGLGKGKVFYGQVGWETYYGSFSSFSRLLISTR